MSSLYTLSELMQLTKEDMGITELPKTITDQDMINRFKNSALKDFSQIHPLLTTVNVSDDDLYDGPEGYRGYTPKGNYLRYRIPKFAYAEKSIISIVNAYPMSYNAPIDQYIDYGCIGGWDTAINVMMGVANVRAAATVVSQCYPSMTWDYMKPDIVMLYNACMGAPYTLEMLVTHDPNLSTIEDDAFITLREITLLDMQGYFYNKLKRYSKVNTGVGDYDLMIDDWADSLSRKMDYLKELAEDCNLDYDTIRIFQ